MKKLFFMALIAVALTAIGCGDSKKNLFPLEGSKASQVETTTVTETGDTTKTAQDAAQVTTQPTEQTGTTETAQTPSQPTGTQETQQTTQETTQQTTQETTQETAQTGTQETQQQTTQETTQQTTQETTQQPEQAALPADQNKDQNSSGGFEFATVKTIGFDLSLLNSTEKPVGLASVKVNDSGTEVTASISNSDGKAAFNSTVSQTCTSVEIVIEHPEYVSKTVKVENIQDLAVISRTIYLEKKKAEEVIDTDKDGVPDDKDQYPNDPKLIASVSNEYTIAFEDLYPMKGDADFNDLVVKFGLTEYINPENRISKINIKSKVLAVGAGYKNEFWMNVNGKDYQLIADPKKDTMNSWNSKKNETFVDTPVHSLDIVYENPIERKDCAPMPYDPYIKANGSQQNQVHLPFVTTKFVGKVLDTDKFPWAVLVPDEWLWPYEKGSIFNAYPEFKSWYESGGKENQEWYLHPNREYTFPVPYDSAITAYLLKIRPSSNTAVIAGLLGVLVVMIVGINIWRRKTHKAGESGDKS